MRRPVVQTLQIIIPSPLRSVLSEALIGKYGYLSCFYQFYQPVSQSFHFDHLCLHLMVESDARSHCMSTVCLSTGRSYILLAVLYDSHSILSPIVVYGLLAQILLLLDTCDDNGCHSVCFHALTSLTVHGHFFETGVVYIQPS